MNRSLHAAKATKQDEFYTQLPDIEKELKHYTRHFAGKTVLCNCDDPKVSSFFTYFSRKFNDLKLKKLITTCYKNADPDLFSAHVGRRGVYLVYEGERTPGGRVPTASRIGIHPLEGDGDFRSPECTALLKEADIVVTNPPFSLFREYVAQLMEHKLFNQFGEKALDPAKLEEWVEQLMMDEDVTSKPGIYLYVLDGDERHLNIRAFSPNMKREAYERQRGVCVKCRKKFDLDEMEADHIKPWHEGGKTDAANCQMLCKDDNRRKSGR